MGLTTPNTEQRSMTKEKFMAYVAYHLYLQYEAVKEKYEKSTSEEQTQTTDSGTDEKEEDFEKELMRLAKR